MLADSRHNSTLLAQCLAEWREGADTPEARAAPYRIAELINMMQKFLTKD